MMTDRPSAAREPDELTADDRIAIQAVLARWNLYEDYGLAREWAGLFTVDGVSTSMKGKVLAGHEALAANARARWAKPHERRTAHWIGPILIEGNAERALARHHGMMIARPADPESDFPLRTHAERRYELIKEDGEWRILRRTISEFPPSKTN